MTGAGAGLRCFLVAGLVLATTAAHAQTRQPGWEVRVSDRIELAHNAPGELAVSIAVDRGLTVSKDASVIIDLAPPPGVVIKKRRLQRADAVDPEADAPRFTSAVRAEAEGEHTVGVRVRFWVCGGRVCRPIDVKRNVKVVAAPPPAPPPSAPPADAGAS